MLSHECPLQNYKAGIKCSGRLLIMHCLAIKEKSHHHGKVTQFNIWLDHLLKTSHICLKFSSLNLLISLYTLPLTWKWTCCRPPSSTARSSPRCCPRCHGYDGDLSRSLHRLGGALWLAALWSSAQMLTPHSGAALRPVCRPVQLPQSSASAGAQRNKPVYNTASLFLPCTHADLCRLRLDLPYYMSIMCNGSICTYISRESAWLDLILIPIPFLISPLKLPLGDIIPTYHQCLHADNT